MKSRWSSAAVRWFVRLVVGTVALEILYLVAAHAWLHTKLSAFARRAGAELNASAVLTLYPGDLRADNISILKSDPSILVEVDSVRGNVKIWPLLIGRYEARFAGHLARAAFQSRSGDEVVAENGRATAVLAGKRGKLATGSLLEVLVDSVTFPAPRVGRATSNDDAHLERVRIAIEIARDLSSNAVGPAGRLSLDVERGELFGPSLPRGVALSGRAQFERHREPFAFSFSNINLSAHALDPRSEPPTAKWSGKLEHARASLTRDCWDIQGALQVHGADAAFLLDVLGVESGGRWMLAELEGDPFTLALDASLAPSRTVLEDIVFDTPAAHGRGAVYAGEDKLAGAVLVTRGNLSIGISLNDRGVTDLEVEPERLWLTRALEELELHGYARPPCRTSAY